MDARRGFGLGEIVVVLLIVVVVGLLLLTALPRRRELSRLAICRRNLSEIGVAMALVDTASRRLPSVKPLGPVQPESEDTPDPSGPLALMLRELGLPSFVGLTSPENGPTSRSGAPEAPGLVPGFVCPADGNAATGHPAPVSYRAATGSSAEGTGGVFSVGGPIVRLADVEEADGGAYTAAFAERLLGSGQNTRALANYALIPGPSVPEDGAMPPDAWRGDAGNSWWVADWISTLYNHAITPNAEPSWIVADQSAAHMGASSGHVEGVHVLKCDLSVVIYTPRVDPKIWRALGDYRDATPETPPDATDRPRETNVAARFSDLTPRGMRRP